MRRLAEPDGRSARPRRGVGLIEAGTTCEGCASSRCGKETRRAHDRGLMAYLWCANVANPRGAYQYFTISPGEVIGA